MKKILLFLFLIPLFVSCENEYIRFHTEKQQLETAIVSAEREAQHFTLDSVAKKDFEIQSTPSLETLNAIISAIDQAKKRVYLEVYIFTEKRLEDALKKAKLRWVDVRVILERNVYGARTINLAMAKRLTNAGISVSFANNKNFVYTHAKFFIIDDSFIIATGNMSHATFTTNRDFFIEGADAKITEALVTLFEEDEKGEKSSPLAEGLILASFNGRTMLERLIESAQKNILIYAENFSDERIATLLETKKKAGVSIAIVMTDPKSIRDNATFIQRFHDHGIRVCAPKKPYIHAKMTLIDQRAVLIGSMNFSTNSIDNNREVSLLFAPEKTALETLIKTFNTDCQLEFRLN